MTQVLIKQATDDIANFTKNRLQQLAQELGINRDPNVSIGVTCDDKLQVSFIPETGMIRPGTYQGVNALNEPVLVEIKSHELSTGIVSGSFVPNPDKITDFVISAILFEELFQPAPV